MQNSQELSKLTCERCHKTSSDVVVRPDPYMKVVENEEVKRALCDDCYDLLCDEI